MTICRVDKTASRLKICTVRCGGPTPSLAPLSSSRRLRQSTSARPNSLARLRADDRCAVVMKMCLLDYMFYDGDECIVDKTCALQKSLRFQLKD